MIKCKKVITFPKMYHTFGDYRIRTWEHQFYHIDIRNLRNNYRVKYEYRCMNRARRKLYKLIKELRKLV